MEEYNRLLRRMEFPFIPSLLPIPSDQSLARSSALRALEALRAFNTPRVNPPSASLQVDMDDSEYFWEVWHYNKASAEDADMTKDETANNPPGCDFIISLGSTTTLEELSLEDIKLDSISNQEGMGFHLVRPGVHPIRTFSFIHEGIEHYYYMSLTYPIEKEKDLESFWFSLIMKLVKKAGSWREVMEHMRGVEIECRPNKVYKICIWTRVINEETGKKISQLMKDLFNESQILINFDAWHSK